VLALKASALVVLLAIITVAIIRTRNSIKLLGELISQMIRELITNIRVLAMFLRYYNIHHASRTAFSSIPKGR